MICSCGWEAGGRGRRSLGREGVGGLDWELMADG